jgi:hypothetical protein
MPLEKYELQSFPPQLSSDSDSKASMSYTDISYPGQHGPPMHAPDPKLDAGYPWRGTPQRRYKRPSRLAAALDLLKALLLPFLAISYLSFCYVVHYRVVPVNTHGIINVSPQNIGQ